MVKKKIITVDKRKEENSWRETKLLKEEIEPQVFVLSYKSNGNHVHSCLEFSRTNPNFLFASAGYPLIILSKEMPKMNMCNLTDESSSLKDCTNCLLKVSNCLNKKVSKFHAVEMKIADELTYEISTFNILFLEGWQEYYPIPGKKHCEGTKSI